ncbi:hypothetical protein [Synechocystis sp. LKSZ1]
MAKAHNFNVTRIERYVVVCYEGETGECNFLLVPSPSLLEGLLV